MSKRKGNCTLFFGLLREVLYRLKKEMWSWRGLCLLVIGAYLVLDAYNAIEKWDNYRIEMLTAQGFLFIWVMQLFPPRMGKLLFLLPFSAKERIRYLGNYVVLYATLYLAFFIGFGGIASAVNGYPFGFWMKQFMINCFPVLLFFCGSWVYTMCSSARKPQGIAEFFLGTKNKNFENVDMVTEIREDCSGAVKEKKEEESIRSAEEKAWQRFNCITVCLCLPPIIQCCLGWWFMGVYQKMEWLYLLVGVLCYVCAVAGFILYWFQATKEISQRTKSGKEACECNL